MYVRILPIVVYIRTVYIYNTRQKECNERAAAALISAAYCAPRLSLHVRHTLMPFLKVRRLVKHRNPNPEANHKSVAHFLLKICCAFLIKKKFIKLFSYHKFYKLVAFFLTRTVYIRTLKGKGVFKRGIFPSFPIGRKCVL